MSIRIKLITRSVKSVAITALAIVSPMAYCANDNLTSMTDASLEELLDGQASSALEAPLNLLSPQSFRLSIRPQHIALGNIQHNDNDIAQQELLNLGYHNAPQALAIDRLNLTVCYGVNDWLSTQLNTSFQRRNLTNRSLNQSNNGISDTQIISHVLLFRDSRFHNEHSFVLKLGVSLPTASISDNDEPLPFLLELGSGTTDAIIGLSYANNSGSWSWGAQSEVRLPQGNNDAGYRLGRRHVNKVWLNLLASEQLLISTSIIATKDSSIKGTHQNYDAKMLISSPAYTPDNMIQHSVNVELSGQYQLQSYPNHQLTFTATIPLSQQVSGIGLVEQWRTSLGWQVDF